MARPYPSAELERLRRIFAADALLLLATHAKRDTSFAPIKAKNTERWHANVNGREFEFLVNGPRFYDVRAKRGGGGAIDIAIYLFRLNFKQAVALLQQRGV